MTVPQANTTTITVIVLTITTIWMVTAKKTVRIILTIKQGTIVTVAFPKKTPTAIATSQPPLKTQIVK